jgi:hypothetical protein
LERKETIGESVGVDGRMAARIFAAEPFDAARNAPRQTSITRLRGIDPVAATKALVSTRDDS